jgi:hypothetical protein
LTRQLDEDTYHAVIGNCGTLLSLLVDRELTRDDILAQWPADYVCPKETALTAQLFMPTSPDTLLRRVKEASVEPDAPLW